MPPGTSSLATGQSCYFKSQEHLKNLVTAVEIMSVHTDLHRHKFQSSVSTIFPGHCLQPELWFKFCVKRVSC